MAGVEDRFLIGEVVIERRLPDPELLGDVLEGRGVVAPFPERPEGRVQDLRPSALALGADVR
jgi:hypothetical protein